MLIENNDFLKQAIYDLPNANYLSIKNHQNKIDGVDIFLWCV